jgi:hypothetical protein
MPQSSHEIVFEGEHIMIGVAITKKLLAGHQHANNQVSDGIYLVGSFQCSAKPNNDRT